MYRPITPPRSQRNAQRGIAPLLLLLAAAAADTTASAYLTQTQTAKTQQAQIQTVQPTVWLDEHGKPTTFTHQNK